MNNTGVTGLTAKKKTLSMRVFGPRNSAYAVNLTYETYRHIYIYIYIYHAKSRLNTPVWGSLRSPNYGGVHCAGHIITPARKQAGKVFGFSVLVYVQYVVLQQTTREPIYLELVVDLFCKINSANIPMHKLFLSYVVSAFLIICHIGHTHYLFQWVYR